MSEASATIDFPKRSYRLRSIARRFIYEPLDKFAALTSKGSEQKDLRKRVVFARLDSVGDYIVWTAAFPEFEKIYPSEEFERILIAGSGWANLAEKNGFFNRVVKVQRKRFVTSPFYRFTVVRRIKALDADIFINPTQSRDLLWVDSLAKICGAGERIGSKGINNRMSATENKVSDLWYSRLIEVLPGNEHEIINNIHFAAKVAGDNNETLLNLPDLPFINKGQKKQLTALLFLGANHPYRRWPAENFAAAAQFLSVECGLKIILGRGPGEESLAEEFLTHYKGDVEHLTGKTSLIEMAEIMSSTRLLVSNDTGPAHMAAAVGCPAVVIMSGAELGRFFPYPHSLNEKGLKQICATYEMPCFGCSWNCVFNELPKDAARPCITGISSQNVIEKIKLILSQ